jgi:DNA-binding GntR family transcriptional regulator
MTEAGLQVGVVGAVAAPRPSTSLVDHAYQAIVQAIVDRQLAPGSRLSIDGLAAALEVSITPVREALARAAAERLVVQDANRGFTVAALLGEHEYHQLFDVRRLLELHALAVAELDAGGIERLASLGQQMNEAGHGPEYRDFRAFNQMDRLFHRQLVALSGNSFLIEAWSGLHFHLHVGRLFTGAGVIDFREAITEHAEVVEALRQGDREGLVRAVSRHIAGAERRLRELIPRGEG